MADKFENNQSTLTAADAIASEARQPPSTLSSILGHLGPGFIMAAAIVGSGELIATTKTGAEAGIALLWLIIVGCVIKVFVQIEIGRATIITGKPTLSALDTIPGPRIRGRGNWLVWYWFIMWFCSIGQLGGIVGGCGQAIATFAPLTERGKTVVAEQQAIIERQLASVVPGLNEQALPVSPDSSPTLAISEGPRPIDDVIWCIPIAIATSLLLIVGRYGAIQAISTVLVVIFTAVTLWNVIAVQQLPDWQITGQQFIEGLSFGLPKEGSKSAVVLALSTVGIIGVGAAELIQYPYWCLEKGYARWTGRNDGSASWLERARGWLRVMKFDAWVSMVVYTFATIAFYILGVAILHRTNLIPEDSKMFQTLMSMYTPVFGSAATPIFIVGALVVLYSTFFVANASHARTFADGLAVMNAIQNDGPTRVRWVRYLSGFFPILCLIIYVIFPNPPVLVLISGVAQTLMLPMLGFAALVFRYRDTPKPLTPSMVWDIFLFLSVLVMLGIAIWQVYAKLFGG